VKGRGESPTQSLIEETIKGEAWLLVSRWEDRSSDENRRFKMYYCVGADGKCSCRKNFGRVKEERGRGKKKDFIFTAQHRSTAS
jgi:hypothetical protein